MSMPIARTEVLDLITRSLRELREDLGLPELAVIDEQTPLLGAGSDLDSLAVVHLVVDLENRLREGFGKEWILADERALSRTRSPFRDTGHLADFILETTPSS